MGEGRRGYSGEGASRLAEGRGLGAPRDAQRRKGRGGQAPLRPTLPLAADSGALAPRLCCGGRRCGSGGLPWPHDGHACGGRCHWSAFGEDASEEEEQEEEKQEEEEEEEVKEEEEEEEVKEEEEEEVKEEDEEEEEEEEVKEEEEEAGRQPAAGGRSAVGRPARSRRLRGPCRRRERRRRR